MDWGVVADRFAVEYGWTPDVIGGLDLVQVHTFWCAIQARKQIEAGAMQTTDPTAQGAARLGPRPPVARTQGADGRAHTTYTRRGWMATHGVTSDKPLR